MILSLNSEFINYNSEELLALFAGILIIVSQVIYIVSTFKKKVQPSILSWLGWAILTGTSFTSQYLEVGWNWSMHGNLFSI